MARKCQLRSTQDLGTLGVAAAGTRKRRVSRTRKRQSIRRSAPGTGGYITLYLWPHRPATCCEVPLTPGAAGPGFVSMEACQDGQEEALHKWFAEDGPVFGFTEMAGDGYRIEAKHCDPVVGGSFDSE